MVNLAVPQKTGNSNKMKPSKHPFCNFRWPNFPTVFFLTFSPVVFFRKPTFSMKSMTHHKSTKALEQVSFSLIKAAIGSLPWQVANFRSTRFAINTLATGKRCGPVFAQKYRWIRCEIFQPCFLFNTKKHGVSGN